MLDWVAYPNGRKILMILSYMFSGITFLVGIFFFFMAITQNWMLLVGEGVFSLFGEFFEVVLSAFALFMGLLNLASSVLFFMVGVSFLKMDPLSGKTVKKFVLPPEEDKVVQLLKSVKGGMTQKQLTTEIGCTKVKMHRILKRLEQKKIIESHQYGMTNKIMLR